MAKKTRKPESATHASANDSSATKRGRKPKTPKTPPTTAERLGSVVKSCRKIMRKDKGLNGDLDRLPMLTWIMFLKFLDDMEQIEESDAKMKKARYHSAIESPYRWRDWAAKENGITGPELLSFITQEKTRRPDGTEGPGLLKYLGTLQNGKGSRRQVIGTVFGGADGTGGGITSRMQSGYLLRDVINAVNSINFLQQDELFTLGFLYESMLREMRDAAGDSGEFYTPRPVVRFMVEAVDPRLGEVVLDPACGTGGFLVEAFSHLQKQAKSVQQRETLQSTSIRGGEPKSLPYLLCQMNLLLHGVERPQIDPANSLDVKVTELGDKDRVDAILTNPPFGGEEERGILSNFPADMQTTETAMLFLQLIMRKLRRAPKPGRAAVIVPNGTLFGDGVCAKIKEDLILNYNLHTVVRLPQGVFEPYTPIPTNVLFFEAGEPTRTIWYYELALPEGRKKYTKTQPMQFEEFAACLKWFKQARRTESTTAEGGKGWAWKVDMGAKVAEAKKKAAPHWKEADVARERASLCEKQAREAAADAVALRKTGGTASKIDALWDREKALKDKAKAEMVTAKAEQEAGDAIYWPVFNLDIKNPFSAEALEHLPPETLADSIAQKSMRISAIMDEVKGILGGRATNAFAPAFAGALGEAAP
ncbi:MAG: N-6 DNA methylase [Phycisphaerales bacterium]